MPIGNGSADNDARKKWKLIDGISLGIGDLTYIHTIKRTTILMKKSESYATNQTTIRLRVYNPL